MATKKSIYKSPDARKKILDLYESKAKSLDFPIQEKDINTSFGKTRVIISGNEKGKKLVLFHGIHGGSPLTLESISNLQEFYHLYAIDTIGQATKSAETIINIKDDSFAKWADEVLDGLSIVKADFVGISYGAFILQKLITYRPAKVNKTIFIVPSGLANGNLWPSIKNLSIPLIRYHITKKDTDLKKFIRHFVPEDDQYMLQFQKAIFNGVYMDYRRPTILKKKDVEDFMNPIYIITADNDVFFPTDKTIKQAKRIFNNLQEIHILKNCKHMPHNTHFAEIEEKIKSWID